tara:strand:+ start:211 stop:939 length:729 start_codon:yes stop_codon:yes gene_type:complete
MSLQSKKITMKYESYKESNFLDSKIRLLERFKKNKVKLKFNKNDKILIFGNVNYFQAVKSLGNAKIEATDICERPNFLPNDIKYKKIINNKLPFKDNSFNFVFSNGILSHLSNTPHYFKEIYRVLNKDGLCWVHVDGASKLSSLRLKIAKKLNGSDLLNFKKVLINYKWDSGKINFILELLNKDNINFFKKTEIVKMIINSGFKKYKFCPRGYKTDLSEQIFRNKKLKKVFNFGELRYLIYK